MAPSAAGGRFAPVNLNKLYGKQSSSSSSLPSSAAAASSARSRASPQQHQPGGAGGMPPLSRPPRSQPSSSSLKALKLTVPPPLNLPSLRREHSGSDPNVTLVAGVPGGSFGWSKQPANNAAQATAPNDVARSVPLRSDTLWRAPSPDLARNGEVSHTSHTLHVSTHPVTGTKADVLYPEDFPTLQASLPPPPPPPPPPPSSSPSLHPPHQQSRKEQTLPQQHKKLSHPLPENSSTFQSSVPQLQHSHHAMHHSRSNQPIRNDAPASQQGSSGNRYGNKANGFYSVPAPLIRLNHTSTWTDDERETLHTIRPDSEMEERDHVHNLSRSAASSTFAQRDEYRGGMFSLPRIGKSVSLAVDGLNGRDDKLDTHSYKETYNHRASITSRDRIHGTYPWEPSSKGGWRSAKDSLSRMDASLTQLTVSDQDAMVDGNYSGVGSLGSGLGRCVYQESSVRDVNARNGYVRDGGYENESTRRGTGSARERNFNIQADRLGRNTSFQQQSLTSTRKGSSFVAGRSQHPIGNDFGMGRRHAYSKNSSRQELLELELLGLGSGTCFSMERGSLDLKVPRRKKDTANETFPDPVRESFDADIENVQKDMEQKKQKKAEADEKAREQQKEQERIAREEEEHRRKLEQEARDAALREERRIAEAFQKLEQERRLREEEKQRLVMEEERRKEAARQKLRELEERIAKRENEKMRQEAQKSRVDEERTYIESSMDNDGHHGFDQDDDRAPFRVSRLLNSSMGEASNRQNMNIKQLDRGSPLDAKSGYGVLSEYMKATPAWRRDPMDHGNKITPRDGLLSSRQCESSHRKISSSDSLYGSQRSMAYFEEQDALDSLLSTDSNYSCDQWSQSNNDLQLPADFSHSDLDPGYSDIAHEKVVDHKWTRNYHPTVKEGYHLSSPPTHSYVQSTDVTDILSWGRSRQLLPKQPRVLPPPPPMTAQKAIQRTDITLHLTAKQRDDNIEAQQSGSEAEGDEDAEADAENVEHESVNDEEEPMKDEDKANSCGSNLATEETFLWHMAQDAPLRLSETDCSASVIVDAQNTSHRQVENMVSESQNTTSNLLTECSSGDADACVSAGNENILESEIAEVATCSNNEGLITGNLERDLVLELEEEGIREPCIDRGYDEAVEQNLESHGIDSSKNMQVANDEFLANELKEVIMAQNDQMMEGEVTNNELLGEPDMQLNDSTDETIKSEAQSKEPTDVSDHPREALQILPEPPIQGAVFPINAVDLAHLRETDSRQSLVQQFQKPFSFMAMPLLHSNASSTTSQHPLELAPFPGFQSQPELPFQLQLGLFPGTPLLPNAIQIGSIQMPLNLHHQMPQLAHMHSSQAPVFQFGQIIDTHSTPPSQPLPIMQPTMQVQHPLCQIAVNKASHSYSAQAVQLSVDTCHAISTNNGQVISQPYDRDVLLSQNLTLGPVGPKSTLKASNHVEVASTNASNPGMESEFSTKIVRSQQADAVEGNDSGFQKSDAIRKMFKEVSSDVLVVPSDSTCMAVNRVQYNDRPVLQSHAMPQEGRIRGSGVRQGFSGQGHGRYFNGKAYEATNPNTTSESNIRLDAGGSGPHRQIKLGYRREFRVKDAGSQMDTTSRRFVAVGMRQPAQESSHSISSDTFTSFNNKGILDEQSHSVTPESITHLGDGGQNIEAPVSCHPQSGRKNWPSSERNFIGSASSSSCSLEQIPKKCMGLEASNVVSSQRGVARVFEQPGIETLEDKNDFIEVRSKRQMLNDRREQREKENKAKSKDTKVKEHFVQKSQRFPVKAICHSDPSIPVSSKASTTQIVERQSPFYKINVEADIHEIVPAMHNHVSGEVPSCLPSSVNTSSQLLAPVGTLACFMPDMPLDRWARSSKQMHDSSSRDSLLIAPLPVQPVRSVIQGSSSLSTTVAWGGQRSTQQVDSFTQTKLKEVMKPVNFVGSLSQELSSIENDSMAVEPVPLVPKVSTTVSEPVGLLLTGQGIQFGAVTVPNSISYGASPLLSDASGSEVKPESCHVMDMKREEIPTTRSLVMQVSATEGCMCVPLPTDISVENSLSFQLPVPQGSSGPMLPPLLGGPAGFSHLEMGGILGGPIFALAPREDTLPIAHGTNEPFSSLEPGHPSAGLGCVGGWQQRHVGGMMESFYGSPSGFTTPFINPTGGISCVHGAPQPMLVYTNPFTPVGQYGQLGVSFMGPAYIPSGKQPDWKHIHVTTSSSGFNDGERVAHLEGKMGTQHDTVLPSIMQNTALGGASAMPTTSPLNLFDSNTFQSQWCNDSGQHLNIPLSRPLVGLTMQRGHPINLPSQSGSFVQMMETTAYHPIFVSKPAENIQRRTCMELGNIYHLGK